MKVIEREVFCGRCKGTGEVWDVFYNVFTFGFGFLGGKDSCPDCNGTGRQWLRERIVEAEEVKP